MRWESEIRDGVGYLRLEGRFVTGSDAELASAQEYLRKNGVNRAVIDFRDVPYIDSTGLAFVVELHKSLVCRGGQLLLANANQRVREVLEMTRIDGVIPTFAHTEDAEAALRAETAC
ncbi:MAG TPA: STAS domain-containing protein [Bryobacteraceae bacterium]|nr:STAS domain-containing protein [Bryobacteraceae bacterium]